MLGKAAPPQRCPLTTTGLPTSSPVTWKQSALRTWGSGGERSTAPGELVDLPPSPRRHGLTASDAPGTSLGQPAHGKWERWGQRQQWQRRIRVLPMRSLQTCYKLPRGLYGPPPLLPQVSDTPVISQPATGRRAPCYGGGGSVELGLTCKREDLLPLHAVAAVAHPTHNNATRTPPRSRLTCKLRLRTWGSKARPRTGSGGDGTKSHYPRSTTFSTLAPIMPPLTHPSSTASASQEKAERETCTTRTWGRPTKRRGNTQIQGLHGAARHDTTPRTHRTRSQEQATTSGTVGSVQGHSASSQLLGEPWFPKHEYKWQRRREAQGILNSGEGGEHETRHRLAQTSGN